MLALLRLLVSFLPAVVVVAPLAAAPQPATPRPTVDQLQSATVSGIYRTPITLAAGKYEGPPIEPGAATRPRVTLWSNLVAFGNLDDAPGDEAAMLLSENSGGTGEFVYLAVMAVRRGRLTNLATTRVGDRVKVRTLTVTGQRAVLEVIEAGPADPMCCPTRLSTKAYALEGGALRLARSTVTGVLSIATLGGAPWVLVEIDGEPLPAGAKAPTIAFDGPQLSGFDGCNRFSGQVQEKVPGTIQFGPLAATRMSCPPPADDVERAFSAGLAVMTRYTFLAGRLELSGTGGQVLRSLKFER